MRLAPLIANAEIYIHGNQQNSPLQCNNSQIQHAPKVKFLYILCSGFQLAMEISRLRLKVLDSIDPVFILSIFTVSDLVWKRA
jgi:hypothetical protein